MRSWRPARGADAPGPRHEAPARTSQGHDGHDETRQGHEGVEAGGGVPAPGGVGDVGRGEPQGEGKGEGDDGHVDEEDRAPPEVLQEEAADGGPGGGADDGHRAPHTDRGVALDLVVEGQADERQGRGHHDGGPHAQQGAGEDERPDGGRQGGREGGQAEDAQAEDVHPPVADPVAQGARAQQQAREDEGVGVDDPQLLGLGGMQLLAEPGQGRVEDGVVQADHEQAQGDDGEEAPPLRG